MQKFKSYRSSNIELGIIFSHEKSLYKATVLLNDLVYIYQEQDNSRPELLGYFIGAPCIDKVYASEGEITNEQTLYTFAVNRLEELERARVKESEERQKARILGIQQKLQQEEQARVFREQYEEREQVKPSLFMRLWGKLFS